MAGGLNNSFGNVPGKSSLGGKGYARCHRLHKKVQTRSNQFSGGHSVRRRVVLPTFHSAEGKVLPMPTGASACHQCHGSALRLTGDLVFTVISKK
jgi:hypothetical protein